MPALRKNSEAKAAIERYGTRTALLNTFHVAEQSRHAASPERCITGAAPSLIVANEAYGEGTAEEWLMYQIVDFGEYVGARDKITTTQLRQLCQLIVQQYGWLKLTDLELFFQRMKQGTYGRFYGAFDPQQFMQCFRPFLDERNNILTRKYEREDRERREHQFEGCITIQEYRRRYPERPDPLEILNTDNETSPL